MVSVSKRYSIDLSFSAKRGWLRQHRTNEDESGYILFCCFCYFFLQMPWTRPVGCFAFMVLETGAFLGQIPPPLAFGFAPCFLVAAGSIASSLHLDVQESNF